MVPKFQPSLHKSVKQFGYSFAFDAPTLWNALRDEIVPLPSLFQEAAQNLRVHQGKPALVLHPLDTEIVDCFGFVAP